MEFACHNPIDTHLWKMNLYKESAKRGQKEMIVPKLARQEIL
jgi:hypothetical protein